MRVIQLSALALSLGLATMAQAWGPGWNGPPAGWTPPNWGAPPAWDNRTHSPYWNNRVRPFQQQAAKQADSKDKDAGGSCATVDDNKKSSANRDRRPPWARGDNNWRPYYGPRPPAWNAPDRPAWPDRNQWAPPAMPAAPQWAPPRW